MSRASNHSTVRRRGNGGVGSLRNEDVGWYDISELVARRRLLLPESGAVAPTSAGGFISKERPDLEVVICAPVEPAAAHPTLEREAALGGHLLGVPAALVLTPHQCLQPAAEMAAIANCPTLCPLASHTGKETP